MCSIEKAVRTSRTSWTSTQVTVATPPIVSASPTRIPRTDRSMLTGIAK